ncbi:hypothetical protein PQR62_11230 [Herbaspirillum lusitanum]|uniref:Phage tail protein n=1 Tax=Herbaspirillum lusitanum TaxID=213312 RepID=A0ABW9AA22_9BURK
MPADSGRPDETEIAAAVLASIAATPAGSQFAPAPLGFSGDTAVSDEYVALAVKPRPVAEVPPQVVAAVAAITDYSSLRNAAVPASPEVAPDTSAASSSATALENSSASPAIDPVAEYLARHALRPATSNGETSEFGFAEAAKSWSPSEKVMMQASAEPQRKRTAPIIMTVLLVALMIVAAMWWNGRAQPNVSPASPTAAPATAPASASALAAANAAPASEAPAAPTALTTSSAASEPADAASGDNALPSPAQKEAQQLARKQAAEARRKKAEALKAEREERKQRADAAMAEARANAERAANEVRAAAPAAPVTALPGTADKVAACQKLSLFSRESCLWGLCNGKWGKDGCPSYQNNNQN